MINLNYTIKTFSLLLFFFTFISCSFGPYSDDDYNGTYQFRIDSPQNMDKFIVGDAISIKLKISDTVLDDITSVDFLVDDDIEYSDLDYPYSMIWFTDELEAGTFKIKAVGLKGINELYSSHINLQLLPKDDYLICKIISPEENSEFDIASDIVVKTDVRTDPFHSISRVDFYANDSLIHTDMIEPYQCVFNPDVENISVGDCLVKAKAVSSGGREEFDQVLIKIADSSIKYLISNNGGYLGNDISSSFFQDYNKAYGVVFDLSSYNNVELRQIDFYHRTYPDDADSPYYYNILIVDWGDKTIIKEITGLSTRFEDFWENIQISNVEASNFVGIFIQPQSWSESDEGEEYYLPNLVYDGNGTETNNSFIINAQNPAIYNQISNDFLIDLWIKKDPNKENIKIPQISKQNK